MSTNSGADENEMTTLNITAILNGGGDATAAPSIVEAEEEAEFVYRCGESDATTCAETCFGLEDCLSCECTPVYTDAGGPWGDVMDLIFCLLPIMYLIYATVKPNPTPTTRSLPLAALLMLLVRLMYLNSNPILVMGCVILGVHETLTPLSIMAGAITLFETMEATKCLPYMMREMKALTAGHPIAECMLLFAFAYLVEGASGFGTPVALGAPMLVSTGNPAMESVVIMLCFNTFATVWGKFFIIYIFLFYSFIFLVWLFFVYNFICLFIFGHFVIIAFCISFFLHLTHKKPFSNLSKQKTKMFLTILRRRRNSPVVRFWRIGTLRR